MSRARRAGATASPLRAVRRVAALALLASLGAPRAAPAAEPIPGLGMLAEPGSEVTVDAASISYDRQTNVIAAEGAVKVTRGDMVLTADRVRVYRSTEVAEAEGNVVLVDPQGTLTADALTLNLVDETGHLERGSVLLNKNRYQLTGRRFEKEAGQSYRVEDGTFTTCLCGSDKKPDWSVRGEHVTLDLQGYGHVRGGRFEVKGVPVFYVPYGLFPLQRERQSGLLFPRTGISSQRGFQIEQPFYVAINKSMDATLSLDIETAARIGALAEYRYAFSQDTLGEAQGSYFNEQIRGASSDEVVNSNIADPNIPLNRWSAALTHDQWLPAGMHGFADVFRVSDDLFLREINVLAFNPGVDVALRTRRFERSRVGVERPFAGGTVLATSTWYQDFINPDRFVFQMPPRVEGVATRRFLDDRVAVSLTSEGTNFTRDSGFAGQRLDLWPQIEVPWRFKDYAYGSWQGGFRETAYALSDTSVPTQVNTNPADPGSKPPSILPALQDEATREVFYVRGEAGTAVARVVPFHHFGLLALKHTIEPTIRYLYVPRTDTRQSALPLFDAVDRVNQRSVFTYGATTRLLARLAAKEGGGKAAEGAASAAEDEMGPPVPATTGAAPARGDIRELGRFSIFQSYDMVTKGGDFIDEVDEETGQVVRSEGTRVSDLGLYLRLTPASFLRFEGRTDYSVSGHAKGAMINLALSDPRVPADDFTLASLRGRSTFAVGYRFVANSTVDEVNGGVLYRLSKHLYGAFETRYDSLSHRFLEIGGGVRVISDCECWVVDVGVSNRINPDETQARVLVSLVGLGQVGREPFRRSLGAIAAPVHGVLGE